MRARTGRGLLLGAVVVAGLLYAVQKGGIAPGPGGEAPETAPAPARTAWDGTPRGLIDAALAAHGLRDRPSRIGSVKMENVVTLLGDAPDRVARSVEWYRFPDRVRVDFSIGPSGALYVYDGVRGWSLRQGRLAEASDQLTENLRRNIKNLPVHLLPSALDERSVLGPVRPDSIADRSMLTLTLTDPEGDQTRLWFDAESFLLTRIDYALFSSAGVDSMRLVWWNFREIDGIRTAGDVAIFRNGVKVQQNRTETIEYDAAIPDSFFVRPKGRGRPTRQGGR
jgi:hypothetical protein